MNMQNCQCRHDDIVCKNRVLDCEIKHSALLREANCEVQEQTPQEEKKHLYPRALQVFLKRLWVLIECLCYTYGINGHLL